MGKYTKSLMGPTPWMVHGGQYKAANVSDATAGRVIIDPRKSLAEMSRPKGRTSYVAGTTDASCDAD